MRFDTGLADRIFGKKLDVEVPDGNGGVIRRQVSAKWLEKMEREGHARQVETVTVHIGGTNGHRTEEWLLGTDVTQAQYDALADKSKNEMYSVECYDKGVLKSSFIAPDQWPALLEVMARFD